MFKPLLRRNFSLYNRFPHKRIVQSAARDGYDSVTIQRVRIKRPFLSKSRLVGTVAVSAAIYGLGRYLGVEVEIREEEQSTRSGTGQDHGWQTVGPDTKDDEDEEESDGALLFLPTGLSRPRPRTFYRNSDPEWQEFVKLTRDKEKLTKILNDLAATIRQYSSKVPAVVTAIGNVDTKKGKQWFEINFPDGPPIEFERPGVELTEDLEWRKATRPVEAGHHARLHNLLAPKAVATAVYQDTKRRASKSWKDFKIYMGWHEESQTETVKLLARRIEVLQKSLPTPSPTNPFAPSSAKDTQQSATSPAPADGPAKDLGFVLPDPKSVMLDLTQFRGDFRKASAKNMNFPVPPRGTFVVRGLVQVYGDRARLTFSVHAVYDPKQGRYVELMLVPWNSNVLKQRPRGGL